MREYAKVGPKFWIGDTGRMLRGTPEAQIVAAYLVTGPHASMTGMYYLPKMLIAHETGLTNEGALKGLQRAIEAGFCGYDEITEVIWVYKMALYQIGDNLSDQDKRCKGVQNEYENMPENPFLSEFYEKYKAHFHLTKKRSFPPSPNEAPSKPHRSQEQEQEQELTTLSGKPDGEPINGEPNQTLQTDACTILAYLNEKASRAYRPVPANIKLITARIKEGATVEDIKSVIDRKCAQWQGDEKMEKFLRPETLFRASKFASYVGEAESSGRPEWMKGVI